MNKTIRDWCYILFGVLLAIILYLVIWHTALNAHVTNQIRMAITLEESLAALRESLDTLRAEIQQLGIPVAEVTIEPVEWPEEFSESAQTIEPGTTQ